MENFNEYWELLADKRDSIAKEIIAYYKTLDDREDGTELSEACRAFLQKNLLVNPYPSCQLLKLLAASRISGKNASIYEIATAAVLDAFSEDLAATKRYSILANGLVSMKAINGLKMRITDALDRQQIDLQVLVLAVFSRRSFKLLLHLLPELSGMLNQQHTADAIEGKQHFLHRLLAEQEQGLSLHQHRSYLHFVRQVVEANRTTGGASFAASDESFEPVVKPSDIERMYLLAYQLELKRCAMLQRALTIDEERLPVAEYSQHTSVLALLVKGQINVLDYEFPALSDVIVMNHMMLEEIEASRAQQPRENVESMIALHVQTIIVLYKAIETSQTVPNGSEQQQHSSNMIEGQLKSLLKEADLPTFLDIIESILTLLFVRSDTMAPATALGDRKHFLCSFALLNMIASCVKTIMITRKHSEASDKLCHRFQKLFELVNDMCWRLSLFVDTTAVPTRKQPAANALIQLTVPPPIPTTMTHATQSMSESGTLASGRGGTMLYRSVESMTISADGAPSGTYHKRTTHYGTLPRHKPVRKQYSRTAAPNQSGPSGGSNKELLPQRSHSIGSKAADEPVHRFVRPNPADEPISKDERRAFTKLFATPETLALACLTSDKVSFAKQIIENHGLQERPVGCLVQRMEQMETLSSKLIDLVQKQERRNQPDSPPNSSDSDTLLHDIRTKTAVGFEVSKVLSTIETFLKAQTDGMHADDDDGSDDAVLVAPMDRFVGRYPFLGMHTGKNLHLSQIVDIVLTLPFKYELNLSVYNFLLKNVQRTTLRGMSASTINEGNGTGMGGIASGAGPSAEPLMVGNFVSFFGTLIDTMHIALKTDSQLSDHRTIGQLLTRELCPIDAVENGLALKRRARFHAMAATVPVSDTDRSPLLALNGSVSHDRAKQFLQHLQYLLQLTTATGATHGPDSLLRMDVRNVLLEAILEGTTSITALATMAAKLGINMVQTIGRWLLSALSESAKEIIGEGKKHSTFWQFLGDQSELLRKICSIQLLDDESENSSTSPLVQYKRLQERTGDRKALPIHCDQLRSAHSQANALFPVVSSTDRPACCLLLNGENDTDDVSSSNSWQKTLPVQLRHLGHCSVDEQAIALLDQVEQFAKASEWISASEHLLTAIKRPACEVQLQSRANELRMYVRVGALLRLEPATEDWRNVRKHSLENSSQVLQQLIEQREYTVCADWIKRHPIDPDRDLEMFMYAVRKAHGGGGDGEVVQETEPSLLLFGIIETMPIGAVVKLYEAMLVTIRNVPIVRYMLRYLQNHGDRQPLYQKYHLSLTIFEHLSRTEYDGLWNLVSRPLLILEQCLMNSRLELLAGVIRSIRPLLARDLCRQCFEHREYIRDLQETVHGQGQGQGQKARNPHHDGLYIGHECVDCLLRIYASKALEYKVFPNDLADPLHHRHDPTLAMGEVGSTMSLDSLAGEVPTTGGLPFVLPKEIPPRDQWIKDEETLHCMCCRRTFSMLNRRHHCRRCGRVVCHSCSKRKQRLGSFYEEIPVRICDDCGRLLGDGSDLSTSNAISTLQSKRTVETAATERGVGMGDNGRPVPQYEWQLTGNERYDRVIRDEYSYEYAPSTGQCLAICDLHTPNEEIASFLLYHCAKLEGLLRPLAPGVPNPEIDYALVARMLLNLTLGVKVRRHGAEGGAGAGGAGEVEKMKEHAEIILSIVHDNCESLLLDTQQSAAISGSHHPGSLRKLCDALVKAEKWTLALELSLKCGFSVSGVLAAWGMTCLRAGCYETAREKFSHCLPRIATEQECDAVLRMIEAPITITTTSNTITSRRGTAGTNDRVPLVKRPVRSPPLLGEILYVLKCTARVIDPLDQGAISGSRIMLGTGTIGGAQEPATNIQHTLANLKRICQGEFGEALSKTDRRSLGSGLDASPNTTATTTTTTTTTVSLMCSRFFEESMHYLLAYGSHQSIVAFLMKHRQTELVALRYILVQRVESDVFLQAVLLPCLQRGQLELLVQQLTDLDETLLEWRDHLRYACRYLETNEMLNSLYSLQLLLKDPIRASMTCVRFYTQGCRTFSDLHAAEHHLKTSATHLQNELELCNWQEVRLNSAGSSVETHPSLLMKLDPKELNNHINTILLQLDVTKFLAKCEAKGRQTTALLPKIIKDTSQLPTLFGSAHERLQLAILTLVCGQNVEEAFGLSYRIIQDYSLDLQRVYALTAKYFINHGKIEDVNKLLDAILSNGNGNEPTAEQTLLSTVCDDIVRVSVETAIARHGPAANVKVALEALINRISSVAVRIHCYITTGQLKTAYLLANRHHRTGDIRKILRQAQLLGQMHVKRLCEARLQHQDGEGS
ncbi:zinc finger FYVE domain-containing protein 26 homolog [Anopheles aquasalis]|uniref:zinc finger FYVE domain-containing protein 26 homolog n=1 Tax=Anopheles aquasalis TaxID=42839 RepID=UPI00215AA776|nr:zinc finger FYVE domain-containing protein 26 homolog [Anopheles aquasalis]